MAPPKSQYHHYIPRFILKQFAHVEVVNKRSISDGLLHVYNLSSGQFHLEEVGKTCGAQNLYYNASDVQPMRIEHLFSKLEARSSGIFRKIVAAVADGLDHIDILEKDIHTLFKFMNISMRRSEAYRNDIKSKYRENDFMFRHMFEQARKRGRSDDPAQFWLDSLLYLLQTSHEDLLADAEKAEDNPSAYTYKHFIDSYALQIWKAADGYEYFLNERLVDFEGDTVSFIGAEVMETGNQLIMMTTDELNHLVLPINPEVAIVFCDESRCWESPFADSMHQLQIPYPENSLLKNAPHKDIENIHVPAEKRGKKRWPATMAWRVNIGTLTRHQNRIIASYSLNHARSFIVVRSRARFERAKRECQLFNKERVETWKSRGTRVGCIDRWPKHGEEVAPPSPDQVARIKEDHISALDAVVSIINTRTGPMQRNKENAIKSWLAIRTLEMFRAKENSPLKLENEISDNRIMHSALKAAFEDAYPPKHPDHRDLIAIDFDEFFSDSLGEQTFAQLSLDIDKKISDLIQLQTSEAHWEACKEKPLDFPTAGFRQGSHDTGKLLEDREEEILRNPTFQSVVRAAQGLDILKWMFEERQDILATFVRQLAVPMKDLRSRVIRIRTRRG